MSTTGADAGPRPIILPVRQDWLDRRPRRSSSPTCRSSTRTTTCGTGPARAGATCSTSCWPTSPAATASSRPSSSQCGAMYRADGPEALRPVGETEFVNGVAAMSASGGYGPTRVCAGIVGHADLTLGDRVQAVLEAHLRAGGGRFRGIRHTRCAMPRRTPTTASRPGRCSTARPACSPIPASAPASRAWRRSASPSTPGCSTRRSPS